MTLTLEEVLRQVDLGLDLLVGNAQALGVEVAGSAVLQLGQQPRQDHRSLLLLTSGMPGGSDADADRRLVAAARRAGAAGIIRATAADEPVPDDMRTAAEENGLPLLTAPPGTSLRAIRDAINERVTRADLQLYQRLLTLQSSLIAAVSAPDSTGSLLRRLGAVVNSTVILYYPDGRLLAVTGDGPTEVIWRRIDKNQQGRQRFTVGQWHVVASLINGPEDTHRWIVLAKRGSPTSDEIVSPLVATVEQLLDVIALNRRAAANEEALQRADVLVRLVSSNEWERFGWDHVRPYGFVPHAPCYVAAFALPQWSARRLDPELHAQQLRDATQILRGLVANSSSPHLVAATDGVVVLLLQTSDTEVINECVTVLRGRGLSASAGIGRKVASLGQIVNSYRDARLALTRALTRPDEEPTVQRFEDFTVADIAISTGNEEQLRGRARDLLAKLEGSGPILETLIVYLEDNLSINDTANDLHIHPNSVRYRISRAGELVGRSLRDLPTIVDLYLALQVVARTRTASTAGPQVGPNPDTPAAEVGHQR